MNAVRARLIDHLGGLVPAGCVRVAVDGVDGVGKTTFAGELAGALRDKGRDVVHVSADGFLNPRAVRYQRGRNSPEGFWLDSYDYETLAHDVLEPFGPGGSRRYRPAARDVRTDQVLDLAWRTARPDTVLLLDGLFLHRDELVRRWDFSLFLHAPFEVTVARLAGRDGSHPDPSHPSVARYIGGQRLYFAACTPWQRATVLIDNTDLTRPALAKSPAAPR